MDEDNRKANEDEPEIEEIDGGWERQEEEQVKYEQRLRAEEDQAHLDMQPIIAKEQDQRAVKHISVKG